MGDPILALLLCALPKFSNKISQLLSLDWSVSFLGLDIKQLSFKALFRVDYP